MDVERRPVKKGSRRRAAAFTIPELVISTAIAAISIGGVIYGYVLSAQSAEWSAFNLAANSLAVQRLEQTRAAKWDRQAAPSAIDQLVATNFLPSIEILDIPISGTNVVYATNVTTIRTISTTPPLKMIQVDCSWRFTSGRVFTNSVVTYRAPDQ